MKILKKHLVRLWYEDQHGKKYLPNAEDSRNLIDPPKEFNFQVARFPLQLTTEHLRLNRSGNRVVSSRHIATATQTINKELATAIIKSGDFELDDALMIAAICCERCMNVLAWKYGLNWGYREKSMAWKKAGTNCQFCEDVK